MAATTGKAYACVSQYLKICKLMVTNSALKYTYLLHTYKNTKV